MITDEKQIMEIGKELAKKMKEHYQECKGGCDFCCDIPETLDMETMDIKESDCICAFWDIITHTNNDECWAFDDDTMDCFGCDLAKKLHIDYPESTLSDDEVRDYESGILNPIRSKFWKKEGVVD